MAEGRFQHTAFFKQRRHRSFEKDTQSAFFQQQELFKQLKNTENKQPESTIVNVRLEEKATCKKDTNR